MKTTSLAALRNALAAATLCGFAAPALSLNIMLANDDGCNSEGITAMADALEAAGHTLTMYAPAGEQSGKGGSINTTRDYPFDISNVGFHGPTGAENRKCVRIVAESPEEGSEELLTVSASPRDSVLVGLAAMADNPPDLVITGINSGQNIGTSALVSGTVNGAMAAIQKNVPAIAVSRSIFAGEDGMSYADGAEFVVRLVAELEAKAVDGQLMAPYTGLNVNTPSAPPRGVAFTTLGYQSDLRFGPALVNGEVVNSFAGLLGLEELVGEEAAAELEANPEATIADFAAAGVDINDESSMYAVGFITVTVINADPTANLRKRELIQLKLRDLN